MLNNDLSWSHDTDFITSQLNSYLCSLGKLENLMLIFVFEPMISVGYQECLCTLLGWNHSKAGHKYNYLNYKKKKIDNPK